MEMTWSMTERRWRLFSLSTNIHSFPIGPLKEIASLSFVHGVLVRDVDELQVILALAVRDIGEIGVTFSQYLPTESVSYWSFSLRNFSGLLFESI